MGNKRRQRTMTPQKGNNHKVELLMDNEGDESSVAEIRKMKIRIFNKLKEEHNKEDIKINPVDLSRTHKKTDQTQKHLNELKADFNKHLNEMKEIKKDR
jgi:hypothetical protein